MGNTVSCQVSFTDRNEITYTWNLHQNCNQWDGSFELQWYVPLLCNYIKESSSLSEWRRARLTNIPVKLVSPVYVHVHVHVCIYLNNFQCNVCTLYTSTYRDTSHGLLLPIILKGKANNIKKAQKQLYWTNYKETGPAFNTAFLRNLTK